MWWGRCTGFTPLFMLFLCFPADRPSQDTGTINRSTSGAYPDPEPEMVIVFVPLLKFALSVALPGVLPSDVGRKAIVCWDPPFTEMLAYRGVESPFSYFIRIVVIVLAVLLTLEKTACPLDGPPK